MKIVRRAETELTDKEVKEIFAFLEGRLSSRKLGKLLGLSHQGAINLARKWKNSNLAYKT